MNGSIRQRPSGSWELRWYVGRDADGKPQYGSKSFKGSETAARKELGRIVREIEHGSYVKPERTNVADFLRRWLRDYASITVTPKTLEGYTMIVERHLVPHLGRMQLQQLDAKHIQEYYAAARKEGAVKGGKLSAKTVRQHHAVLRKALKCAVRWGMVVRNAADMVDAPKPETTGRPTYTPEQLQALVQATDATHWGPIMLIAAATGMRRGEILALTWDDIDVQRQMILVSKSVEETVGKNGLRIKEPKSKSGRRAVDVPENVINRLLAYKEQQEAKAEEMGKLWTSNNLVCPDDAGNLRRPDSVSSQFRDWAKKAGVPSYGIHAVRHSHATYLANLGWQAKFIQERLGHSTIAITMDIYSHVLPTTQRKLADDLKGLF